MQAKIIPEKIYELMSAYKDNLTTLRQLARRKINVSINVRKPKIINKPINAGLMSDSGVFFVDPNTTIKLVYMNDWQLVLLSDCDKSPHMYIISDELSIGELMDIIILDHYYHFIIKHQIPGVIKPLYDTLNKFANDDYSTLIYFEAGFANFIRASIINDSPSLVLETSRENVKINFPNKYDKDKLAFIYELDKIVGGRITRILHKRIKFYETILPIIYNLT